ncbi:MAG: lysophospholipid acyltransferase family protein [Candidatus Omnitrophota bacterium]
MVYSISRFLSLLIFKIVFRLEVHGQKNIPEKGGFILAGNHVSYLDPVAVGVACPRETDFMARHDLFSKRFLSWWLPRVRAFPVKRDSPDASALKEAIRRLRRGRGLVMFPEGSRRDGPDGTSAGPQPGIGFIAVKADVPVIPAFVKGTERALPRGAKFIFPAKVSVYFGKQIHIEKGVSYQSVAKIVMDNIKIIDTKGEIKNDRNKI